MGTFVGTDGGWLQTLTNYPLFFTTNNGQPTMTLATNGKLAIGTTPDANAMLTVLNNGEGLKQTNGTVQVGTYLTAGSGSIKAFTNHAPSPIILLISPNKLTGVNPLFLNIFCRKTM